MSWGSATRCFAGRWRTLPAAPGSGEGSGRWLAQARHDLADGRLVVEAGRHALACFLAQQCAEKAVTAFLLGQGAEAVWGGALADLCEDAVAFDPTFEAVRSMAILLDKHHLGARYPTTIPGGVPAEAYDATDSSRALEIAGEVLGFVEGRA